MFYNIEESIKHRKKQDSNISDASKKSDHKHIYVKCLLEGSHLYLGRRCSVCEKTVVDKYFLTKKVGPNSHVMISEQELRDMHRDLPIYKEEGEF